MFAIRVSYPGGHSVWLTRRFPTVTWGLKKDALPFPTEADAARGTHCFFAEGGIETIAASRYYRRVPPYRAGTVDVRLALGSRSRMGS